MTITFRKLLLQYSLFVSAFISCLPTLANTYYLSTAGNDFHSASQAQQPQTPWKTLGKLQTFFDQLNAGDSVLFKRSDVFEGALIITKSGSIDKPIVFSSYGIGDRPVISGFTRLSNWTAKSNGTFETNLPVISTTPGMVVLNGSPTQIGRYPNATAPNKGYLNITSTNGSSQITDNNLGSSLNWSGGEVVIRKARWVLDRSTITAHSGNTINYISQSPNQAIPKFGYFIQNHPGTLDTEGEWYYDAIQQKLGIYLGSKNLLSVNIKATTVQTLVTLHNKSNILFDEIRFEGANAAAFQIDGSQNITLQNCEINLSGVNAINASSSSKVTIQFCVINHTNNIALNFTNCSNGIIRNNTIKNTGTIPGMGKGDSGAYEAIMIDGDDHLIELNQIDSTGYIPITFRGNLYTIQKNFITNYTLVKDDGGGIYTWNNIPNAPFTYGTRILDNIILNGVGAGEGTEHPDYKAANGIYMDDNTANVEISGNTVANCALYGIYIHNAHEITLNRNTIFNNRSQIVMSSDAHAAYSTIRNTRMVSNIFISREGSQPVAEFKTQSNDIRDFGFFDSNYYSRPVNDFMTINTSFNDNGYQNKTLDLASWKTMYGKDNTSKKSPVTVSSPDLIRFEYNERATAKTITLDTDYIDVKNNNYKGSLTLQPFTSVVLLKQATPIPVGGCATGSIALELWNNNNGNDVPNIPLQRVADITSSLQMMEFENVGDAYGSRMRGYVCPPVTGSYIFSIAGDDAAELWLSTNDNPSTKRKIASFLSWTGLHEWNKFPTQKSGAITLTAGNRYYIEVLHKEGAGGDHLSVAWQLPNGTLEAPIPGIRLSPFGSAITKASQTISFGSLPSKILGEPPFDLAATSSSGLPVSFTVVAGPGIVSGRSVSITGGGTITIEANQVGDESFNAATPVQQSFSVTQNACINLGSISREQWNNVHGNDVPNIPLLNSPSLTNTLSDFEINNAGDRYGTRIRGFICPPQTGEYAFTIAGDDAAELWLSADESPANKVKIASFLSWTGFREWNKFPSQKSPTIMLQAGRKYYIEALHKEGEGGDHLSVAWQLPDGSLQAPIPASRLSPYATTVAGKSNQNIAFPALPAKALGDPAFSIQATASSGLPVSFRVISGPVAITGNVVALLGTGNATIEAFQVGDGNYNAATPIRQTFIITEAPCLATGEILYERWSNIGGHSISSIPFQSLPNYSTHLTSFNTTVNAADNYGARISGYVCIPETGNYTFMIAADDVAELWLSSTDDRSNKKKIAEVTSWTGYHEWNKFSAQPSAPIALQSGKSYYIEALLKEGDGADHLAVGWKLPSGITEAPIPASRLSSFINPSFINHLFKGNKTITTASKATTGTTDLQLTVYPNPFHSSTTVQVLSLETEMVNMTLHDLRGSLVRNVFSGVVEMNSTKNIVLEAKGLADGVYILRAISGKHVITRAITFSR